MKRKKIRELIPKKSGLSSDKPPSLTTSISAKAKRTKLPLGGKRKIRFFLSLTKEFLKRRYRLLLLGFLFGIVFSSLIPFLVKKTPLSGKTVKIGIVGKYTLDEIPDEIQLLISRGLTRVGAEGEILPDLAESWQIEEEGEKYVFELKKDTSWVDDQPFTARDVNYNFEDAQMEINNDYQITFYLKDAFSPFPLAVSKPIFKRGLVGLGSYRIGKIEFNGKYVQLISLQPLASANNSRKIIFKFYPTEEAAKLAIKLGEINQLNNVLEIQGLENFSNLKINSRVSFDRFVGLFFNTEEQFLEDKLFRQALAYGLKKNYSNRALVPLSPQNWAYYSEVKTYDYNFEKAKELMKNSLGEIEPSEIELTIFTVPQLLLVAEEIKNDWLELGLKVEIAPFTPGQMDFQVLLAVQEIPVDPDQYSLWHSTSQSNITRLKNPRIDKLLEDGRVTLDQGERKSIYYDFQKYLAEELPVIFLYYPEVFNVSRK